MTVAIALRFLCGRSFACAVRRYNSHGCDETVSERNDILDLLLASVPSLTDDSQVAANQSVCGNEE
jgi:hypothetical protein